MQRCFQCTDNRVRVGRRGDPSTHRRQAFAKQTPRGPKSATLGLYDQRDAHIESIAKIGRMGWQKTSGYNDRALVEAQIGRWKAVIGNALKSRKIDTQIAEVQIGAKALNRMTSLGRAVFEPV